MAAGDDSCFVRFSKFILIFINVIFFLIGAGLITAGALCLTNLNTLFDINKQSILNANVIWGLIIFGIIVLLTATAGCCGAMMGGDTCGKTFLTIYSIIVLLVMLAEIGVGIAVLLLAGELGAIGEKMDQNTDITKAKNELEEQLIKTASDIYSKCCANTNTTDVACNTFLKAYETDNPGKPGLCANYDKNKDPKDQAGFLAFVQAVASWLARYTNPAGIALITLSVVELLCLIAACHVMCHAKSAEAKAAEMTVNAGGQPQYAGTQAQTNNLAYGAPEVAGELA